MTKPNHPPQIPSYKKNCAEERRDHHQPLCTTTHPNHPIKNNFSNASKTPTTLNTLSNTLITKKNDHLTTCFISRKALIHYMIHEPYSTLIIDCRDRIEYEKSHIMTSIQGHWNDFKERNGSSQLTCISSINTVHHHPQQLQLQEHYYYHEQILLKCKEHVERIILVYEYQQQQHEKNTFEKNLRESNKENINNVEPQQPQPQQQPQQQHHHSEGDWNYMNHRSKKQPKIYILVGGFSEFYHYHSNLCWNFETMKEFCIHEPHKEIPMKEEEYHDRLHQDNHHDHSLHSMEKSNTITPHHNEYRDVIPHLSRVSTTLNSTATMVTTTTTSTLLPSMNDRIRHAHQLLFSNLSQRVICERPTKLFNNLYLGNVQNSMNFQQLSELGVTCIINAAVECENVFENINLNCTRNTIPSSSCEWTNNIISNDCTNDKSNNTNANTNDNPSNHRILYCNIPVRDSEDENISLYFEKCFQFIEMAKKEQRKTLVHCFMGMSRSACLVVACLMKFKEWSLEKAFKYVKKKRPSIEINCGFMKQLVELEKKLFNNENTSTTVKASRPVLVTAKRSATRKMIPEFILREQESSSSLLRGDVTPFSSSSSSPPTHPQTPPNRVTSFENQFESKNDD
nr:unnamed protein product [Naegleria fowleri]